jgi:hypothetical protein
VPLAKNSGDVTFKEPPYKKPKTTTYVASYLDILTRCSFIGAMCTAVGKEPMLALLVPIENAVSECQYHGHDITASVLKTYLKNNDVHVFGNINDFVKAKKEYNKTNIRHAA